MNIEEQIGIKIRELRNQNGLTQEELADRTELTKGFISQLERGLTAPSVSTLADIVECLGITLAEFFKEDDNQQIVYPREDYFEKVDHNGNRVEWLVAKAQSMSLEPILVTILPGQSMPPDKPHEGEEFGYILKGQIYLHYGNNVYTVREGDSFIYPTDRDHWISSADDSESQLLWISCPPNF